MKILKLLEEIDNGTVKFYWVDTSPDFPEHYELKFEESAGYNMKRLSGHQTKELMEWLVFDESKNTWGLNRPAKMILQMYELFNALNDLSGKY